MSSPRLSEARSVSRRKFKFNRSAKKSLDSSTVSSHSCASEIMGEILDRALDRIHERYMENQTINFTVHCAHQALMKVLRIHFYQHNDYVRTCEYWGPDRRSEPSSPDSWALHQVPLSRYISDEKEVNSLDLIQSEMAAEITMEGGFDAASVTSESLIEDIRAIVYGMIDNLPSIDIQISEKSESVISAFTMIVEGQETVDKFKMKPQLSRISYGESTFRLPKIDLPESGESRRYQSATELAGDEDKLPPIRTDANYKCRSQEEKSKKPKK